MFRATINALAFGLVMGLTPASDAQTGAEPSAPLEAFQFRDWRAGDPYVAGDRRFRQCVPVPSGEACVFEDDRIAGVQTRQIGAAFGRTGLYALEAKFPQSSFGIVEAALRDRYGPPCEEHTTERVNALLMRFESRQRIWCFSDGRATLAEHYDRLSESVFIFQTNDADQQAGVRDF